MIPCLSRALIALAMVSALIFFPAVPAFAACSAPGGNEGDVSYSGTQHVMAYCNGTTWIAMGAASSSSGFGTLTTGDFCTATSGTAIACTTASTGSGSVVLATSPSIATPTLTGTVTLSGLTTAGPVLTNGSGVLSSSATLSGTYGGTGVNNGSNTITVGGNLTTAGAASLPAIAQGDVWYGSAAGTISALAKNTTASTYLSNTGTLNNPAWAQVNLATGVTGNLPNANLAVQTANTVLGALTATTPSGLAMPSCSGATNALTWSSSTGFGCNSVSGGGSGTVTASPQYQLAYFSSAGTTATVSGDSSITTDSSNDLLVTSGKVGIGSTSPNYKLDISTGNDGTPGVVIHGTSIYSTLSPGTLVMESSSISGTSGMITLNSAANGIAFQNGGTQYVTMTSSGYVGIGTTSAQQVLHVYASSGITERQQSGANYCNHTPGASSETVSCSSDVRLKKDIADSGGSLDWLRDMRIRDFTVRSTGERRTGVIAQEMLPIHPDMVHMNEDGFYTVDEPNTWKLIKAIQELKVDNDYLRGANDKEAAEIKELLVRLDAQGRDIQQLRKAAQKATK